MNAPDTSVQPTYRGKRLPELTLCNILFCVLVVFIHVSSAPVTLLERSSWQFAVVLVPWRLSAFVVQGFLFLSGLKIFLRPAENFSYRRFWRSRIRRIILPYVFWVIIYYLFFFARHYYAFSLRDLGRYLVVGDLSAHFYFIVVLVQFFALVPLWRWMVRRLDAAVVLPFALLISLFVAQYLPALISLAAPEYWFPYTDRVFPTYLFWWTAGCFAGAHYDAFCVMLRRSRRTICVTFALCAAVEAAAGWAHMTGRVWLGWLELWHTGYCAAAILFSLSLALLLADRGSVLTHLPLALTARLDRAAWGVYLIHPLLIAVTDQLLECLGIVSVGTAYLCRIAAVYLLSFASCICFHAALDKIRQKKATAFAK